MRLAAVLLTLATVLWGCAHSPPLIADGRTCASQCQSTHHYRVDPNFSETQVGAIREAMAIVHRASGGRECFVEGGEDVLFVHAPDQIFLRPWAPHGWPKYVGLFRERTIFLVADQFVVAELVPIATHEVMHYLKVDHSDRLDSVMHPSDGTLDHGELSAFDAAKLAEVRHYTCQ